MRSLAFIFFVLLALSSAGCWRSARGGWFSDHGFYAARGHYRVRYPQAEGRLLPPGWQLQNWIERGGVPVEPRGGYEHEIVRTLDRNGDGRMDVAARDVRYELFYEHANDEAMIWVRTTPLEVLVAQRSSQALMRDVVTAFVSDDPDAKWQHGRTMRLGARLLEDGPATFGRIEAWRTIFEIHDLDRPATDPGRIGAIAYIVLARPEARWSPGGGPGDPGDWPMAVFFGYVAQPAHFEVHRTEFENLLDRVDFH